MTRIIRIDPHNISSQGIIPAVEILKLGGIVAYPTETFYGLGVDAFNQEAIRKIFLIKKRSFSLPLLVFISKPDYLPRYVRDVPAVACRLMERFWPGPLTMIFFASLQVPLLLTANTQKIAIRISSHPVANALVSMINGPLTSTSANISGGQSPVTAEEVLHQLGDNVDLIIDGGPAAGENASTIIDVTVSPPQLVRQGVISFDEIIKVC